MITKILATCRSLPDAKQNAFFGNTHVLDAYLKPDDILTITSKLAEESKNTDDAENLLKLWLKVVNNKKVDYDRLNRCESIFELAWNVNKPERIDFMRIVREVIKHNRDMSEEYKQIVDKDYAEALKFAYSTVEFTQDYDVSMLIDLFLAVDNKYLMDEDELSRYTALPERIRIFRGLQFKNSKVESISWSLSRNVATWFAKRFSCLENSGGNVYSAYIDKKHVIAYFGGRGEEEVILHPVTIK